MGFIMEMYMKKISITILQRITLSKIEKDGYHFNRVPICKSYFYKSQVEEPMAAI